MPIKGETPPPVAGGDLEERNVVRKEMQRSTLWMTALLVAILLAIPVATLAEPVPAEPPSGVVSSVVGEGLSLYYKGDYRGAANLFAAAVSADPNDMSARYYLGYSHYRMGEFVKARKNFERAYRINPEYTPVPPQTIEH